MPKIVITGVPGLDGEYPLDMTFTHRDFRTIKQVAGVRANEVMDAINAGDLDIIVALAEIAMRRAGKSHSIEDLWDAEAGLVQLDIDEDESSPPTQSVVGNGSEPSSKPSGEPSSESTEHSPEMSSPLVSGTPEPVSTSAPETSTI